MVITLVQANNPVVPNTVPQLDSLVLTIAKNMSFVEKKLHLYLELRQKQDKVVRFLQQAKEKRNLMRKELLKNCRKLIHTQKMRDHERVSQEKKKEHDMDELNKLETDKVEEIEEKKVCESPYRFEEFNTKTVEVNTEKKRIGNTMRRAELYLSSSDSSTSCKQKRHSKLENTMVELMIT